MHAPLYDELHASGAPFRGVQRVLRVGDCVRCLSPLAQRLARATVLNTSGTTVVASIVATGSSVERNRAEVILDGDWAPYADRQAAILGSRRARAEGVTASFPRLNDTVFVSRADWLWPQAGRVVERRGDGQFDVAISVFGEDEIVTRITRQNLVDEPFDGELFVSLATTCWASAKVLKRSVEQRVVPKAAWRMADAHAHEETPTYAVGDEVLVQNPECRDQPRWQLASVVKVEPGGYGVRSCDGQTTTQKPDRLFPAHKLPEILERVPNTWSEREPAHALVSAASELISPNGAELVGAMLEFNEERVVSGDWCAGCSCLQARVLETRACPDQGGERCVKARLAFLNFPNLPRVRDGFGAPRWACLVLHKPDRPKRAGQGRVCAVVPMPKR